MMTNTSPRFVSIFELAEITGLPSYWLRAELDAGRLPALKVNRRVFVPLDEARAILAARASEGGDHVK